MASAFLVDPPFGSLLTEAAPPNRWNARKGAPPGVECQRGSGGRGQKRVGDVAALPTGNNVPDLHHLPRQKVAKIRSRRSSGLDRPCTASSCARAAARSS